MFDFMFVSSQLSTQLLHVVMNVCYLVCVQVFHLEKNDHFIWCPLTLLIGLQFNAVHFESALAKYLHPLKL